MKRTKPPFRADHVGSYLRTPAIAEARAKRDKGQINSPLELRIEPRHPVLRPVGELETTGRDLRRAGRRADEHAGPAVAVHRLRHEFPDPLEDRLRVPRHRRLRRAGVQ